MAMRRVFAGMLMGGSLLFGQMEPAPEVPMKPEEEAIEQLLSERESLEALEKAIAAARKHGVAEQAVLEARFLFHVDRREDAQIAALLPEFETQKKKFKLSESEIFATEDDWLAVTEYVSAIAAMRKGDQAAFKKHITEAFWLSPKQGVAFAPHVERMRMRDAMKAVQVDFEKKYPNCLNDGEVSLGAILGERKALLLHFWSPWSRECEITLPDFFITAEYLATKGVAVASVLPETEEDVRDNAREMLMSTGKDVPGQWIVDSVKSPISPELKIQSVPVMVLISAEGKVLFNGHPTDEKFWEALEVLNPEIEQPEMKELE